MPFQGESESIARRSHRPPCQISHLTGIPLHLDGSDELLAADGLGGDEVESLVTMGEEDIPPSVSKSPGHMEFGEVVRYLHSIPSPAARGRQVSGKRRRIANRCRRLRPEGSAVASRSKAGTRQGFDLKAIIVTATL